MLFSLFRKNAAGSFFWLLLHYNLATECLSFLFIAHYCTYEYNCNLQDIGSSF